MPEYLKQSTAGALDTMSTDVRARVAEMLAVIRREGGAAIRGYSESLDAWNPDYFRVGSDAVDRAAAALPDDLKRHIVAAQDQVRHFAQLQRGTLTDFAVETLPGVRLGQRHIPVQSVGAYTPGGRYPLIASAIMTIVVPRVAGVGRIVAIAPPTDERGIHAAQLFAMATSGADEIYCLGGVQALAAMAFGFEGLEPVDMIVGAGNAYVAEAKRQLFGEVGIDLLAGPTEILVVADGTVDAELVAIDLLGQAEHGPTSPAVLATTSRSLAIETIEKIDDLLRDWPTADVAGEAWRTRGEVVVCHDDDELVSVANSYAPEHLELYVQDPRWLVERLVNFGSLFIGQHATVAYGDKGIGTNHVLPTGRAARYTGGLWVGKFLKTLTWQEVTAEGTRRIAPTIAAICEAEGMLGHARTAEVRLKRARQ